MDLHRGAAAAAVALALLLGVAGCAAPKTAASPAAASPAAASPAATGAVDVCAMVPEPELRNAVGADPGEGVATAERIDGGRCTWKVTGTHTVLAQFTRHPDLDLPDGAWQRPKTATDVAGATRGWAAAETHTILVVKDGQGLLFTDIALRDADQDAYDALAKGIAAKL